MAMCEKEPLLESERPPLARCARLALLGLLVVISFQGRLFAANTDKKLIEFGWDEPGTAFLATNLLSMARTPFDGCVFHTEYKAQDGTRGSFTWESWGARTFSEAELSEAFADLKSLRPGRFKWNFLRFNTTPARLDWFDDYMPIVSNAGLAARLARAGNCAGILFDIEQYEAPLFDYRKQKDAANKSWESYASQARTRGREVMQAFQSNFPGLRIFLTFGYSLPWSETDHGKKPLAECKYGLLAPFLDGMFEAAQAGAQLIDGYELSYGYKSAAQFSSARKAFTQDLLPIVRDPDKYRAVGRLAFGLWLDRDWRKRGWDPTDLSKNYFSPEEFTTSTTAALSECDEFVWIYTESPRWWLPEPTPKTAVPPAYVQALNKAHPRGSP